MFMFICRLSLLLLLLLFFVLSPSIKENKQTNKKIKIWLKFKFWYLKQEHIENKYESWVVSFEKKNKKLLGKATS